MLFCYMILGYLVSVFGGWLVVGGVMYLVRRQIGYPRPFYKPLDLWLGGVERAIATTLTIFAPNLLAAFVGGWVVLKMATNWQRSSEPNASQLGLAALIGSAFSFSVAIAVGLALYPASLAVIAR
jgi:hypothetical protein